ncbi:interaptin [Nasonia vitripennis]|uniref:Kinetochore protein Nuf2 N-terminal domain-containing protein n=1 Tax=Nasonia vitripennis TaxID=7425 RepID=A0A7M7PU21_NASVI|nr:interaptin [Nasonia vitripennis]
MEHHVLSILQDAGIEVDLKTLQNPTEEFMIDLVMEYLKRFHFDSDKIAKPTPEQLDCLSCEESAADAIKAINLYAALSTICEGIFLKDLTLTDLTSPAGCKKTCKRIQVLFNFLIYVRNKKMEKEPLLLELENRYQEIENFIEQKAELIIKTGAVIHDRETKLVKKEQLKTVIAELQLQMEQENQISINLQKQVDELSAKQQADLAKYSALKIKVQELVKKTKELKGKVVNSPEEYMTRSKQLKKILEEKMEERQLLNDNINRKKKQIENNETADAMIKKYGNTETSKVGEIVRKLKDTVAQISSTKSQIDQLRKEISFLDSRPRASKSADSDLSETIELDNSQKVLSELHNSLGQKQRERDSLKAKLETLQSKRQHLESELQMENKKILECHSQYEDLLKNFKALYQKEIQEEINLRKDIIQLEKMEPENLQSVLQEAGIQVDMRNLQNPTEDFMVYLITEYLKKFDFDSNEISKSTIDQLECLSCPDSASDAIKAINLYSALSSVCNEIFLKDLCLTDITSPGPKRARRQIKILFNFFAYVRNKMTENEMAFVELDNQQKDMEKMIDKKHAIVAKTGATINDRENKLELKQQLQLEIDKIRLEMEENNIRSIELEKQVKNVMIQHQSVYEQCCNLKAKGMKLHKETTDLQAKIVKSPEEYAARSKELKKVLEIKKEERQVLNDSITRKKLQIKNNENAQELVKDLNDKFSVNKSETYKQLKETSEKLEYVQKELNLLKAEIAKWSKLDTNSSCNNSKDEDQKGHEQLLFELENQYKDKEKEMRTQKNILEEMKADLTKRKSMLEDELTIVSAVLNDNAHIVKQYTEHFQNALSEETTLREVIHNTIFKNGNKSLGLY